MFQIKNGKIVLENEVITENSLIVENGIIIDIVKDEDICYENIEEVIDAGGAYVTPGFIDTHADYIEKMAAPRPESIMGLDIALYEFEKELSAHGITTMFHSLSLVRKDLAKAASKSFRTFENTRALADIIAQSHEKLHLIHHRFHLRFDILNLEGYEFLLDCIDKNQVHLLSFIDHTPGQGQYADLERFKIQFLENGKTEKEADEEITRRMSAEKLTLDKIIFAAEKAKEKGIAVASHDDDSVEKLDMVKRFGTTISEFPITMEIAKEAKKRDMYTVAGAPNILLGKSHSGNLSAREAIETECIDILCSDYYPPAMLHAVFKMVKEGHKIEDMIKLVTINPARAVNLGDITGSIEKGKKADILIIAELPDGLPAITNVFVDGVMINKINYRV